MSIVHGGSSDHLVCISKRVLSSLGYHMYNRITAKISQINADFNTRAKVTATLTGNGSHFLNALPRRPWGLGAKVTDQDRTDDDDDYDVDISAVSTALDEDI